MASRTHLCSAGSPEAQGGNQLAEQGNHPFPNNFQLAVKVPALYRALPFTSSLLGGGKGALMAGGEN